MVCFIMVGFSCRLSALCALIGTKAINKPLMSMTKRAAAMIVADLMASSMTPTLRKSRRLQPFASRAQDDRNRCPSIEGSRGVL
jgi:hypothetical protein